MLDWHGRCRAWCLAAALRRTATPGPWSSSLRTPSPGACRCVDNPHNCQLWGCTIPKVPENSSIGSPPVAGSNPATTYCGMLDVHLAAADSRMVA
jgi:hypothetical protein